MKMTDGEKLILLMLCELYEKTGIEGEIDPSFVKSALFGNHLWGIPWEYSGIPFEEREIPDSVKLVVDILEMWSFIEFSYQKLSESEKEKLEIETKPFGKEPMFTGFDGNNETEYMSIANFIINHLDRFQEFKGRSMNSHYPSIATYLRMLDVFRPKRNKMAHGGLCYSDICEILKAMEYQQ